MSNNFHAFLNRGYLFDHFEKIREDWYEEFTDYDPTRAKESLRVSMLSDEDGEFGLLLKYYGQPFCLDLGTGRLHKQLPDGTWTEEVYFNEGMAVYHLLHYFKDDPRHDGEWVSPTALDGVIRNKRPGDPLLEPFSRHFTGRTDELSKACEKLGGKRAETGDAAYDFEALPGVTIRMVFWDADEDFPAQTQILVDKRVTDYIHYETIGCLTSDLFERIEAAEKE